MQVQNLTRGQKLFRTLVLDVLLLAALFGAANSFVSLTMTGKLVYWFSIAICMALLYLALKLRPFDDPYRTAVRSLLDKC